MSEYKSCPPDTDYIEVPGPAGPQGVQGPQGLRGPAGPAGPQGPQGLQGIEGCRGPKGDRGPRGEKGDPGRDGRDGAAGPRGPQGLEGPRGCKGNDGNVKFELLTPEQREMLRGEKGNTGKEGPVGPRGLTGPMGPQGPAGAQGLTGPQGPAGERGPQGERGPIGATGPMGPTGPTGGLELFNHISDKGTWSSKLASDYYLHGKVNWTKHTGSTLGVEETENGYVKDLEVYGNTVVNYVNTPKDNTKVDIKNLRLPDGRTRIAIFNSSASGATTLNNATYTIMFKMTNRGVSFGNVEKAKAYVTIENRAHVEVGTSVKEIEAELKNNSVIKFVVSPGSLEHITKIEVDVCTFSVPVEPGTIDGDFLANDFMIIRGDWTTHITPEYFYGTKSVGMRDGIANDRYYIDIESRNKNLIKEADIIEGNYLKAEQAEQEAPGGKKLRWLIALDKLSITYLVHCKPEKPYTLRFKNLKENRSPICIAGYSDTPENGEEGDNLAYQEDQNRIGEYQEIHFTTKRGNNLLAIYIGQLRNHQSQVNEIVSELQLEEGGVSTAYTPYTSLVKRITLPRQIRASEYLYWNAKKGKYCIKQQDGQDVDTTSTDEHLIHTFNDMTYVYIRSRIPAVLSGYFPIKAHGDYYTKAQTNTAITEKVVELEGKITEAKQAVETKISNDYWDKTHFAFNDNSGNEQAAVLKLPNGFRMCWQVVTFQSGASRIDSNNGLQTTVSFANLSKIIHAQVTPIRQNKIINFIPSVENIDNLTTVKVNIHSSTGGGNFTADNQKVLVLAIGDGRPPQENH